MLRLKNETLVKSRGASERERERERVVISRTRVLSPQRVGFRAFSKSEVSDRSREIRLNFLSSASSLFLSFLSFALFEADVVGADALSEGCCGARRTRFICIYIYT